MVKWRCKASECESLSSPGKYVPVSPWGLSGNLEAVLDTADYRLTGTQAAGTKVAGTHFLPV